MKDDKELCERIVVLRNLAARTRHPPAPSDKSALPYTSEPLCSADLQCAQ
jgi:hypothetical protein